MEQEKNKRKTLIVIIIIILLLLISFGTFMIFKLKAEQTDDGNLHVSISQLDAQDPNLISDGEESYFELQGYGKLEIDKDNPYLNLINPKDNDVYLTYEILYGDNALYTTELIEPGKMIQFEILSCLDAGEHTLTYSINVYDMPSKKVLWSGIKQEQKIEIKK